MKRATRARARRLCFVVIAAAVASIIVACTYDFDGLERRPAEDAGEGAAPEASDARE